MFPHHLSSTFLWAEAHKRFCTRSHRVAATVSLFVKSEVKANRETVPLSMDSGRSYRGQTWCKFDSLPFQRSNQSRFKPVLCVCKNLLLQTARHNCNWPYFTSLNFRTLAYNTLTLMIDGHVILLGYKRRPCACQIDIVNPFQAHPQAIKSHLLLLRN